MRTKSENRACGDHFTPFLPHFLAGGPVAIFTLYWFTDTPDRLRAPVPLTAIPYQKASPTRGLFTRRNTGWLIKPFSTKSESCQSNCAKVPWQGRTAEPAPTSSPASYWAISDCFTTDIWISFPSWEGTYFWFFLLFSLVHVLVHREALPQLHLPGSKRSVGCLCTYHVTLLSVLHKLSMSRCIWSQENI